MITGYLIGDKEVIGRFEKMEGSVRASLHRSMEAFGIRMVGYVQTQKLSGQVLQHRKGTLFDSINYKVSDAEDMIQTITGTNVEYAHRHEYGYKGPETVKAHLRMMVQAWGRPVKEPHQINIRSFTRQANTPVRSFLRTSLQDLKEEARQFAIKGVREGIKSV